MCSEMRKLIVGLLLLASCTPYGKIQKLRSGQVQIGLSVPEDRKYEEEVAKDADVMIDSIKGTLTDEPILMNAIRDSETGEMVATDVIVASTVTARFRNVAERSGNVSISFDVTVPAEMSDSQWQLKIRPVMRIQNDTVSLEPLFITGTGYRQAQMRGYQKYQAFLSSIITDTLDFIRVGQLEIFLQRHFPDTYAMKNDSTFVTDEMDRNLFGVTQKEALEHYTMFRKIKRNEKRKAMRDKMFDTYVKDPIMTEGVRLDTVLTSDQGEFIYRYVHTFRSRPGLKKVMVTLDGSIYEKGECILSLAFPEELTFYISSLSSLVDETPRYQIRIIERNAYDNTKAFIDFRQGSAQVDTALEGNTEELLRVRRCIGDIVAHKDLVLDSLIIMASCSPEGSYKSNAALSEDRSEAVRRYLYDYVPEHWKDSMRISLMPENWEQLVRLVRNDTVMSRRTVRKILELAESGDDPDVIEGRIARMKEYRYLRQKIYPKLRSVSFAFHMHRRGMLKDTIHTTIPDSVYMHGVEALKNLDYKTALACLRPYGDYNAALAMMSSDYNHSALELLGRLDDTDSRVCYLKAVVLSRLEQFEEAMKYYQMSLIYDPSLEYRANLDPELSQILKMKTNKPL